MIVYIEFYVIRIPSSADIYVEQFTHMIEFDVLNPQSICKLFDEDFDLNAWIVGKKATIINKDHSVSIFEDLQLYIFVGSAFLIFMCLLSIMAYVLKKYKKKIIDKIKVIKKNLFWNGLIRSL